MHAMKCAGLIGFVITGSVLTAAAQSKKVPCYLGASVASCTAADRSAKVMAMANGATAAVIIEAKRGIACGDGSDGTCIANDGMAISLIQQQVDRSDLWSNLRKTETTRADLLLKFSTRDRSSLQLCVYDGESNEQLWCENRNPAIALDNDSARELAHFISALRAARQ